MNTWITAKIGAQVVTWYANSAKNTRPPFNCTLVEFEWVVFVCVCFEKKPDCISIPWGSHIMKSEPATHSLLCDTHVISETDMVCLL